MSETRSLSINICISVTHKLHFQPRLLFWVPESSILPFKYLSSTTIQCIWEQIYYPLHLFPQIITDHLSIFLISEMATDLKLILDICLSYTSVPNPSPSLIDFTTLIPFKRIHISFSIVIVLVQVTYLKNCNNVLLSSPHSWDSPKHWKCRSDCVPPTTLPPVPRPSGRCSAPPGCSPLHHRELVNSAPPAYSVLSFLSLVHTCPPFQTQVKAHAHRETFSGSPG